MQPEAGLVRRMKEALERDGWLVRKIQGTAFSRKGMPDLIVVKDGFHCWIEAKQEGGKLTPIQAVEHATLKAFGARVFVAYTPKGAVDGANNMKMLEAHDRLVVSSAISGSH
jgi:Holliday junction resolvase